MEQEIPMKNELLKDKSGIQTWELKVLNIDGTRKVIIVRDYGFQVQKGQIKLNPYKTREERNKEILRLYHEEGLSQVFLGNLFNISQPSVSLIVNGK